MDTREEDVIVVQGLGPFLTQSDGGNTQYTLIFCVEALWEARWDLGVDYRRSKVFFEEVLKAYQPEDVKSISRGDPWDLNAIADCIKGTISGLRRHSDQIEKLKIDPQVVTRGINLLSCAEYITRKCLADEAAVIYLDDEDAWTFLDRETESSQIEKLSISTFAAQSYRAIRRCHSLSRGIPLLRDRTMQSRPSTSEDRTLSQGTAPSTSDLEEAHSRSSSMSETFRRKVRGLKIPGR